MNRIRKTKTSHYKSRYREIILFFIAKYHPHCYFCGKELIEDDFPSTGIDLFTEHHVDGNHSNNDIINREPSHRFCHKSFHTKDNILKKKQEKEQSKLLIDKIEPDDVKNKLVFNGFEIVSLKLNEGEQ